MNINLEGFATQIFTSIRLTDKNTLTVTILGCVTARNRTCDLSTSSQTTHSGPFTLCADPRVHANSVYGPASVEISCCKSGDKTKKMR